MQINTHYLSKLKDVFSIRQKKNPHYSLRAYARDLGLSPATISQVLNGHRKLPVKYVQDVAKNLALSPFESSLFLESFYRDKTKLHQIQIDPQEESILLDESYYRVISEWEHYAVLTLFDVKDFIPEPSNIASRLGILLNRAEVVLHNLLTCGLLKEDSAKGFVKAQGRVRTAEDVPSQALKNSHLENLDLAKDKLSLPIDQRDFSSVTFALDPQRIPMAKAIIREFREKMMSLMKEGELSEVYQMAIQFYPLSIQTTEKSIK